MIVTLVGEGGGQGVRSGVMFARRLFVMRRSTIFVGGGIRFFVEDATAHPCWLHWRMSTAEGKAGGVGRGVNIVMVLR